VTTTSYDNKYFKSILVGPRDDNGIGHSGCGVQREKDENDELERIPRSPGEEGSVKEDLGTS